MELEGEGIRPGRATGPARLLPDSTDARTGVPADCIVVVPTLPEPFQPAPAGYVTDRIPHPSIDADRPVVAGLPPDLFRDGERIAIDGLRGTVQLDDVRPVDVVTSFLVRPDGRILLLRRSSRVGSFQGRWAGVSGYLEDPTAEAQARREIREETGLGTKDLELARTGRRIYARDGERVFVVHPFRFHALRTEVVLDWEHTEAEWVGPEEIDRRPTVPHLDRAWRAVAGPVPRKG